MSHTATALSRARGIAFVTFGAGFHIYSFHVCERMAMAPQSASEPPIDSKEGRKLAEQRRRDFWQNNREFGFLDAFRSRVR